MKSGFTSLPFSLLRVLDTESRKFYDRNHPLYDDALLTRFYTQPTLRPLIDSKTKHKRYFIKVPVINKETEMIDLHNMFKVRSVT